MPNAWRIIKAEHAKSAFSGEGARQYGGRWNSPGVPLIYTSATASLAALELLVHLRQSRRLPAYVVFSCRFSMALVERLPRNALPVRWRDYPAPPALATLGDVWARDQRSAILEVPSAIIESESNFLLNPGHPDFAGIEVSEPQPFEIDLRLLR